MALLLALLIWNRYWAPFLWGIWASIEAKPVLVAGGILACDWLSLMESVEIDSNESSATYESPVGVWLCLDTLCGGKLSFATSLRKGSIQECRPRLLS